MTIDNLKELKDFVLTTDVELCDKIKIVNHCLNIVILGTIDTTTELIEIINDNCNNLYKRIVLGKGINPLDKI